MDQLKTLKKMLLMVGAGCWEYSPRQDRIHFSAELLALVDMAESEAPLTLSDCERCIHPDDWPSFAKRIHALAEGDEQAYEESYRIMCRDGTAYWVFERSGVLHRDKDGVPEIIGAMLHGGLTPDQEMLEVKSKLNTQYGLLHAVNEVAALLLGDYGDDFHKVIVDALGALGDSVQIHRAYVWKNSLIDGRLYCRRFAEWEVDDTIRKEGESGLIPYDEFFPDLDKLLASQGELVLHVDEMGDALSAFPGIEGVVTLLAMPVMLYGEFWALSALMT